jgi:hypothetical protein
MPRHPQLRRRVAGRRIDTVKIPPTSPAEQCPTPHDPASPVWRVLRRAHHRLYALPRIERPADQRDILTMDEAQILVKHGVYSRIDELLACIDTERKLHRLVRRMVCRELEQAIPSIITATAEVLHRDQ